MLGGDPVERWRSEAPTSFILTRSRSIAVAAWTCGVGRDGSGARGVRRRHRLGRQRRLGRRDRRRRGGERRGGARGRGGCRFPGGLDDDAPCVRLGLEDDDERLPLVGILERRLVAGAGAGDDRGRRDLLDERDQIRVRRALAGEAIAGGKAQGHVGPARQHHATRPEPLQACEVDVDLRHYDPFSMTRMMYCVLTRTSRSAVHRRRNRPAPFR